MDNERHTCTAFECAVLSATQAACRRVVAHKLFGLVNISVIEYRTVVAGEYNQCVIEQSLFFKGVDNFAYAPVELYNGIATQAHIALSAETRVGEARNVNIVGGKVHKERLVAVLLYEIHSVFGYAVGYVLVLPECCATAFHIAYASNAVDN